MRTRRLIPTPLEAHYLVLRASNACRVCCNFIDCSDLKYSGVKCYYLTFISFKTANKLN